MTLLYWSLVGILGACLIGFALIGLVCYGHDLESRKASKEAYRKAYEAQEKK